MGQFHEETEPRPSRLVWPQLFCVPHLFLTTVEPPWATTSRKRLPNQNPDWFLRQSNYITYRKRPPKPDIKGGRLWEIPLYLDSLIGLFHHFCVGEHFILKNKLTTEENVSKQASKTFKFIHVGVPPCKDRKLHKGLYGRWASLF